MTRSTSSPKSSSEKAHSPALRAKDRVRRVGARLLAVLFWLLVWHMASVSIGQEILLVSPITAFRTLFELMGTPSFYQSVSSSLGRILSGFALGVLAGTLLAALAYALPLFSALLHPIMYAIKSIPVASFIILALFFIRTQYLSVLMSFLMVLPILYTNVLTALENTDKKLLEMAKVFRLSALTRIRAIYLPAAFPHFLSASALALGMSWKAGIAAEVIALPSRSIGESLYQAKIFFAAPEMFAWTLAILILSVLLEQTMLAVMRFINRRIEGGAP